jgi:hypothetical protein
MRTNKSTAGKRVTAVTMHTVKARRRQVKYKTRKIMVERWVIVEAESDVRVSGEFDTQLEAENELECV